MAFFTYFAVFVWLPLTRDFPWANLLIFLLAAVFLVMGVRRGFASGVSYPLENYHFDRRHAESRSYRTLRVCSLRWCRWLPPSKARQVGQQAPDFTLTDTTGKQVSLTELRTAPIDGNATKGVLLAEATGDRRATPSVRSIEQRSGQVQSSGHSSGCD